jgi:hypothetical protein
MRINMGPIVEISLLHEPKGRTYHQLLNEMTTYCSSFQLVARDQLVFDDNCTNLLEDFAKYLTSKSKTTKWPGTDLIGSAATIYKYVFNQESLALIQENSFALYEWVAPAKPEDLSLFTRDNAPFLVTISHENDAFISCEKAVSARICKLLDSLAISYRMESNVRML